MRAMWRLGPLLLLAVALVGCGMFARGDTKPTPPNVTGEVPALRDAPVGAYGDVAAVSPVDASVAASSEVKAGRYALTTPAGGYLLVSSTVDRGSGKTMLVSSVVDAGTQPRTVNIPPMMLAPFGRLAPTRAPGQAAGGIIGIDRIRMSGPAGLGLGDDAAFALVTGFLDPCQKRGGRLVTLNPKILEWIRADQRLRDSGRADGRGQFNPLTPDTIIEGNVTVAPDGTPAVEVTIRDAATGEVLTRIVEQGRPADGHDIGPFLRNFGRGLAAELCPRPTPTPTPARATARLTVRAAGDSSVEFTAVSRKYYCGGGSRSGQPQQCELDVPRGSEVDFQRTLSLTTEEEARWRLASWSGTAGACATTKVDDEPRGGHCKVVMNGDRTINVSFERRVSLQVTHELIGEKGLGFQWSLSASPQKGSGNPLASMGGAQQNCNLPATPVALSGPANDYKVADPCDFYAMYDAGTTVTIDIRSRGAPEVSTFEGWGGGPCARRVFSCQFAIRSDTAVIANFQQR